MKVFLLGLIFATKASFASYKTSIVDVWKPTSDENFATILAGDGQVYHIDSVDSELIEKALIAKEIGKTVRLRLSEYADTEDLLESRNEILGLSIKSDDYQDQSGDYSKSLYSEDILMSSYVSNFVGDDARKVKSIFKRMRRKFRRRSQCYNRARVWSWELSFNRHEGKRIHTGNTWLFFTRRYIRQYKWKWWFHIAPYLLVNGEPQVLDRSFTKKPSTIQEWTNEFMYNDEKCKMVKRYSEYSEHQEERSCFLILSSVFYWQPFDIENAENLGTMQTEWKDSRNRKAYKNAVGIFAKPPERN